MRLGRTLRWAWRGLVGLVILVAAGAAGVLAWLSTSLPTTEGTLAVAGLVRPATIARDGHGVPYIEAASEHDAYFALGFAHAQDRLFQMDLQRRTGAGTLSELFGARTVGFDRFLRTLGFQRLVETDWSALAPDTRAVLEAYAVGVNAFLAGHEGPWPPEYAVLRAEPAPWKPTDSLLVLKSLALLLATNMHDELTRLRLSARLDLDRVADFWPALPGETPSPLPEAPIAPGFEPGAGSEPGGSNAWVVDGRWTTTGKPLLANDPHLGFRLPGFWYLARIEMTGGALAGATVPGLPFLVLGHNGRLAWGLTNAYVDTQDLFVERIDPADPTRYLAPEGSLAFVEHDETLRVKGEADRILRVRASRHGPIVNGVHWDAEGSVGPDHVLALAWTALEPGDTTADAALAVTRAATVVDFIAAARAYQGPLQNMIVADTEGHIGLTIPGLVPLRPPGIDGSMPAPGWTGTHDWLGFASVGPLPDGLDPPSGAIVAANTRVVPADFPLFLARDWPPRFRAERIAALLDAKARHGVEDIVAMQRDVISLAALSLLPALRALAPRTEAGRRAHALLDGWNGAMDKDRPEPLVFAAWLVEVWRRLVADELGAAFGELGAPDPILLDAILSGERAVWCDDATTETVEDCAAIATAAFDDAMAGLAGRYGEDPAAWRWGDAHRARHAHPIFGRIPVIGGWFTLDQPIGGDRYSIDVSSLGWNEDPLVSDFGAGYRAVYDLSDLDASRFVIAVGQSGNPFSAHYDDLADAWLANESFVLPAEPVGAIERLDLVPAGAAP
ncbi:MAG: penicillin acylase family protein [Alphaproteobacteria bacterium]